MRLAVRLPNTNRVASPQAVLTVAETAEELGYYAVSVDDHLIFDGSWFSCGAPDAKGEGDDRDKLEALQTLAFVAGRTRHLRLLVAVLLIPVREPILVAKQTATLDVLSGGRLIVGAGLGGLTRPKDADASVIQRTRRSNHVKEYAAFGVSGNRAGMVEERLRAIDAIWREEKASFAGRYVSFEEIECFPKPVQKPRPPIWVGGRSEAARRRALTLGDAWLPSQISAPAYEDGLQHLRQLARELGRPVPVSYPVNLFAVVADTDERAFELASQTLGPQFSSLEELRARTIVGSSHSVRRRMEEYAEAGANTMELKPLYRSVPHLLDQMGTFAHIGADLA